MPGCLRNSGEVCGVVSGILDGWREETGLDSMDCE